MGGLLGQVGEYLLDHWIAITGALAAMLAAWNSSTLVSFQKKSERPVLILERVETVGVSNCLLLYLAVKNHSESTWAVHFEVRRPRGAKATLLYRIPDHSDPLVGVVSVAERLGSFDTSGLSSLIDTKRVLRPAGAQTTDFSDGDYLRFPVVVLTESSILSKRVSIRCIMRSMDSTRRRTAIDMTATAPAQIKTETA